MKAKTTHKEQLDALRRIEGQIQGVQRMVSEKKYCIDIIIQLHAAINALYSISEKILKKHIEGCVESTFVKGTKREKNKKIEELLSVIKMLHKLH